MRKFIAMALALWAAVMAAQTQAATLTATPENIGVVWSQAKAGDTLKLVGTFPWTQLPGRQFATKLKVDASKAKVAYLYLNGAKGLTVTGGEWGGLRFDSFADVTVTDASFKSGPERAGTGLWFAVGTKAYAARLDVEGFDVAVSFTSVTGCEATEIRIREPRSDGITFPDSHNCDLHHNDLRKMTPAAGEEHPDAFQAWSIKGKTPVSDIKIRSNTSIGYWTGVGIYNTADGGVDRVEVTDNAFIAGYAHGISINGSRNSLAARNFVGTMPGVRDQALIGSDAPAGLKRCDNIVQAYAGKPAVTDPACK